MIFLCLSLNTQDCNTKFPWTEATAKARGCEEADGRLVLELKFLEKKFAFAEFELELAAARARAASL